MNEASVREQAALIHTAISSVINKTTLDEVKAREDRERSQLRKALSKIDIKKVSG